MTNDDGQGNITVSESRPLPQIWSLQIVSSVVTLSRSPWRNFAGEWCHCHCPQSLPILSDNNNPEQKLFLLDVYFQDRTNSRHTILSIRHSISTAQKANTFIACRLLDSERPQVDPIWGRSAATSPVGRCWRVYQLGVSKAKSFSTNHLATCSTVGTGPSWNDPNLLPIGSASGASNSRHLSSLVQSFQRWAENLEISLTGVTLIAGSMAATVPLRCKTGTTVHCHWEP
jgi:hypothetical protein